MICSNEIIGGVEIQITKKWNLKNLYIRVNPPEGKVTVKELLGENGENLK